MTPIRFYTRLIPLVLPLMCGAFMAHGQDLEPRSYTNLPVGLTFLLVGVARSEGDLSPTPSSPLQDAELTIDGAVAGLAHSFAIAGKSASVNIVGARVCYEGTATFQGDYADVQRCEYDDPKMKLTWNFYGAPALDREEFFKWEPGLVLGASVQASAPLGTYHSEHLINAGSNRWMVRPGVGGSYAMGRWFIDAMASVKLFEDNNNFFNGIKLEQDPLYSVQGHLVYSLKKGRWISLDINYFSGGQTGKDGVQSGDRQENSRTGATYSMPVTKHQSIKLYVSTGVLTRVGNDFDSYGIVRQYRF